MPGSSIEKNSSSHTDEQDSKNIHKHDGVISQVNPDVEQKNFTPRGREHSKLTKSEKIHPLHLFWIFLKIGSMSFGGHMSLVAVVDKVLVERLQLIKHKDILDGTSLTSFLPGAIPINVVAYIGYRLRGEWGAFMCLFGTILPSFILVTGLAVAYSNLGQSPTINKVFLGLIPAIAAVIVSTGWRMSQKEIKAGYQACIALASAVLLVTGGAYMAQFIVLGFGLLGWLLFARPIVTCKKLFSAIKKQRGVVFSILRRRNIISLCLILIFVLLAYAAPMQIFKEYTLLKLLMTFAGISVRLFGGVYVGIPFIQEVVVEDLNWLSLPEFNSALAVGQMTPGPIAISAAFIGYQVHGFLGAIAATIGIFAPSSLLVVLCTQMLEGVKESLDARAVLRGMRPAAIGLIFAAAWMIWGTATPHWSSTFIFIAALYALIRLRLGVVWVIPSAGLVALLLGQ
jgi:chromate transporter